MNIYQALSASYSLLITKSKTYKLDCEILLADTLHIENILSLFSNLNKKLTENEINTFFKTIKEREKLKPISKITKKKEFWNFEMDVTKKVLIPRPETEELVKWILDDNNNLTGTKKVIDLCSGSGCIGIVISKENNNMDVTLSDISEKALEVCKINKMNTCFYKCKSFFHFGICEMKNFHWMCISR